jgi:hypothetical protein
LPGKSNLSSEQPGLAFSIAGEPAKLGWESDPVDMTADDCLQAENEAAKQSRGPNAADRDAAAGWLRGALADGPRPAKELTEEAREVEGIAKRTLERARSALGVVAYRPENPGLWWWKMPGEHNAKLPQEGKTWRCGGVPQNAGNNDNFQPDGEHNAKLPKPGVVPPDDDVGEI